MSSSKSLIVAVDGPAASGKGTLSRQIAVHNHLAHMDTGALYRAVARDVLKGGHAAEEEKAAVEAARTLDTETLDDPALRTNEVAKAASVVAAMQAVRSAVLELQREFAHHPPGRRRGAVLDGRDIGTVVCPDAQVKLFVTASIEARTKRRFLELKDRDPATLEADVRADLIARDERDAKRDISPMKPADGAHLLDTTDLSIEAAFRAAQNIIDLVS